MQQNKAAFIEKLCLSSEKNRSIAVVGGGGKTSLIFQLAEEFMALGKKVIITTTTHMYYEAKRPFSENGEVSSLQRQIKEHGYVITGKRECETGKISGLSKEQQRKLLQYCDILLIEADGSKHKPIKIPKCYEPAIPKWVDTVIGVIGLDALGKPISEAAHRPSSFSSFLKKSEELPIEVSDLETVILSERGLRKKTGDKELRIFLNKSDLLKNKQDIEKIEELRNRLQRKGDILVVGSLKQGD